MKPAFVAVTAAYWAFMLTDGALRMLVLLHFHTLGFSPVQLAYLFVLYEVAGVITNLCAGWIGARFGLALTLYAGLGLQIGALLALSLLDPAWSLAASVAFVMAVQGASGVAKDLTKMSSKSAVKLLAPEGKLFGWVAVLTGSKNAVKGLGFFLGAAALGLIEFVPAILLMAAILTVILAALLLKLPKGLPVGRKGVKLSSVFATSAPVNWLSLARMFLFGARDVWFVVGIPIYFYAVLSDGSVAGNRQAFFLIGSFMALWIILYGAVQAATPRIVRGQGQAQRWAVGLLAVAGALTIAALTLTGTALTATLVAGLLIFGAVFAVNSALHSYLILRLTTTDRVTQDVGFYYMANAGGRLMGTLLSGVSYQAGGLPLMLGVASAMIGVSALAVGRVANP